MVMDDINPLAPINMQIEKITQETIDTKTFRLKTPSEYMPGQFFMCSLFGIGESAISIASYDDKYVDLCIRNVGSVTNKIHHLKKGDHLGIRGPYGNGYPMKEFKGKDILIVGGGTGVAPLKGVIDYIKKERDSFGNIDIFLGFRTPDDILFKYEIDDWKKRFNLMLTVDKADKSWRGNLGVVTNLLDKSEFNKDNLVVLTCGPPMMIKFVIELLQQKKGIQDYQIWVSLERNMKCGCAKCGHCMIQDKYVCKDGPVFNYKVARDLMD